MVTSEDTDTTQVPAIRSTLSARIDERFLAPFKQNGFARRTWFLVTVALVCASHGAILGYLLYRDGTDPTKIAQQQETPVEVVVEPPPPPPPPQQKAEPEIEKPATSAPRAENDSKVDTDKLDKETKAPKADAQPQDGDPKPADAAANDSKADAEQDEAQDDADKKEDVLKADAEALDKAVPDPKKDPPKPPPKPKIAMKKKPKPASQQLAGLSDTPDFQFARKTKKSAVSGGNEDSRYLAIVYGMITQRVRNIGSESTVSVSFEVDDSGNVEAIQLMQRSGDDRADAEVINAVRLASPFPPPPPNRPHSLRATINFAQRMSAR